MKKIWLLWTALCVQSLSAGTIRQIQVVGNSRVGRDAVLFDIPCKVGDQYDDNTADAILKALNRTGYFEDVRVESNGGVITIHVQENPIINKIAYEGLKNNIREGARDLIKLKPRQVLSKAAVQETQQLLLEFYRRQGYLSARIVPKVVRLPQNRVDVVFEIHSGRVAYVRKVNFIGNKSFPSVVLQDVIKTHKKQWFHLPFLGSTQNKVYDPDRFVEDQKELINFYADQGFADVNLVSATAELSPDRENFFLTFYLREGRRYKIGAVNVDAKIKGIDPKVLDAAVEGCKGRSFSKGMLDACNKILEAVLKAHGHPFCIARYTLAKHPKTGIVDVRFAVHQGPKVAINRISVKGNRHTRDNVIRRELPFDEGDAFYQEDIKRAEDSVKALEVFKTVRIEPSDAEDGQNVNLLVDVEEARTGEVFAQFGYSTLDKATITAHLRDPNFRGKSQILGLDFSYSDREVRGGIAFTEPHFLNRALMVSLDLDVLRSYHWRGLKETDTGISPALSYMLLPHTRQSWSYRLHRQALKHHEKRLKKLRNWDAAHASEMRSKQTAEEWSKTEAAQERRRYVYLEDELKTYWGSEIGHSIVFDRRDRSTFPSHGYRLIWSTAFSGAGGSIHFMRNKWSASWHHRLYRNAIFSWRGSFSHVMAAGGDKLRVRDMLRLGGESLRGFEHEGITPVRGLSKEDMTAALNDYLKEVRTSGSDEDKKLVEENEEKLIKIHTQAFTASEGKELQPIYTKFRKLFNASLDAGSDTALKVHTLQVRQYNRLGGTLAWNSSFEVDFPMPFLPSTAEVFGCVFSDFGAVWRSECGKKDGDVLADKHKTRVSVGMSVAWHSPFGMLSVGYAWPIRKEPTDDKQKFLFGYGMKFD